MQHLIGYGSVQAMTAHIKIKRRQSTQSSSDSDDELGAFAGARAKKRASSRQRHTSGASPLSPKPPLSGDSQKSSFNLDTPPPPAPSRKAKTIKQLMAAESDDEEEEEEDGGDQEVMLMPSNGDLHKTSVFRFETSDFSTQNLTTTPSSAHFPNPAASDHYKNPLDNK